jgi:hypothetical protein
MAGTVHRARVHAAYPAHHTCSKGNHPAATYAARCKLSPPAARRRGHLSGNSTAVRCAQPAWSPGREYAQNRADGEQTARRREKGAGHLRRRRDGGRGRAFRRGSRCRRRPRRRWSRLRRAAATLTPASACEKRPENAFNDSEVFAGGIKYPVLVAVIAADELLTLLGQLRDLSTDLPHPNPISRQQEAPSRRSLFEEKFSFACMR